MDEFDQYLKSRIKHFEELENDPSKSGLERVVYNAIKGVLKELHHEFQNSTKKLEKEKLSYFKKFKKGMVRAGGQMINDSDDSDPIHSTEQIITILRDISDRVESGQLTKVTLELNSGFREREAAITNDTVPDGHFDFTVKWYDPGKDERNS